MISQIDLSKYVGKKVRVTIRNGYTSDTVILDNDKGYHKKSHPYILFGSCSYNREGYTYCSEDISPSDIIHIEEIMKPEEIDLSKYVGKKVRVTFRGMDDKQDVIIEKNRSTTYPYFIHGTSLTYTSEGANNGYFLGPYDIIHIEELQMNNYQELENKVKELQAEIDRLKAKDQEQKEVRTFKDEIEKVLKTFHGTVPYNSLYKDYTETICDMVKSYIPKTFDPNGDPYINGYNDAIHKVRENLGLNK